MLEHELVLLFNFFSGEVHDTMFLHDKYVKVAC
jgi:hypothetical protein